MKRPSVADLADAADVSVSTVNRLLHGTAKVRPDTVERITRAAEQIGFYGLGALRIREDESRPRYRLGFLLQQSTREIYQQFGHGISVAARQYPGARIDALIRFVDQLTPEAISADLIRLGEECDAVAVVCADHPQISQTINTLHERKVPVIAYITDLSAPSRAGYVGTDNWKLGRTAAYFIANMVHRSGKIATFIGNHRYQCQDFSDASFRSYIREHACSMTVLDPILTNEDPESAYRLVVDLLDSEPDLIGLYVIGGGISGVLRAIRESPADRWKEIRIVCRDVGTEARKGLTEGMITAALRHPIGFISKELIGTMLEALSQKGQVSMIQRIVPFEILTPENV